MNNLFVIPDNLRQFIRLDFNENEIAAIFFAISLAKSAAAANPPLNAGAGVWARNMDFLMKKSRNYRRLSASTSLELAPESCQLELAVYEVGYLAQMMMIAVALAETCDRGQKEVFSPFYERLSEIQQPFQAVFESYLRAEKVKILNLVHKLRKGNGGQTLSGFDKFRHDA